MSAVGQIGVGGTGQTHTRERVGLGTAAHAPGDVGFGAQLGDALGRTEGAEKSAKTEDGVYQKVHDAAEELVSGALVRPVLAKMRETNQAAPPFAPGLWEKTFGPMLDTEISTRIVRSSRFPLVDAMTDQLMTKIRGTNWKQESGHG